MDSLTFSGSFTSESLSVLDLFGCSSVTSFTSESVDPGSFTSESVSVLDLFGCSSVASFASESLSVLDLQVGHG